MIGWLILAVIVLFFAVIFIRALRFTPKPQPDAKTMVKFYVNNL